MTATTVMGLREGGVVLVRAVASCTLAHNPQPLCCCTCNPAPTVSPSPQPQGYGTVRFTTPEAAQRAIGRYDNQQWDGRTLSVFIDKFA